MAQAAALGRHLARVHPSLHSPVYCSTAVRAEDTARIMLQQAQVMQGTEIEQQQRAAGTAVQPAVGVLRCAGK
jgi:phosphohistidine phosphatase SixA